MVAINMIMPYFERKGCLQRNLYLTVYHYKVLKRYRMAQCQVLVIIGDIGQSASGMEIEHFVLLVQVTGRSCSKAN